MAGRSAEALALFDQAIAANPDLPNPYLGKALVFDAMKQAEPAAETLEGLFAMGRIQDARSREVYDNARNRYVKVQAGISPRHSSARRTRRRSWSPSPASRFSIHRWIFSSIFRWNIKRQNECMSQGD